MANIRYRLLDYEQSVFIDSEIYNKIRKLIFSPIEENLH